MTRIEAVVKLQETVVVEALFVNVLYARTKSRVRLQGDEDCL